MSERSDAEIFAEAARLIEEHGHRKGALGTPSIGFCASGALLWACGAGEGARRWSGLTDRLRETCLTRYDLG